MCRRNCNCCLCCISYPWLLLLSSLPHVHSYQHAHSLANRTHGLPPTVLYTTLLQLMGLTEAEPASACSHTDQGDDNQHTSAAYSSTYKLLVRVVPYCRLDIMQHRCTELSSLHGPCLVHSYTRRLGLWLQSGRTSAAAGCCAVPWCACLRAHLQPRRQEPLRSEQTNAQAQAQEQAEAHTL